MLTDQWGVSTVARNGGISMPTHKDLVELARICLNHARAAHNSEASAVLLHLAHEYKSRAAELEHSKIPDLGQKYATRRSPSNICDIATSN
jgi:hypothetical protein